MNYPPLRQNAKWLFAVNKDFRAPVTFFARQRLSRVEFAPREANDVKISLPPEGARWELECPFSSLKKIRFCILGKDWLFEDDSNSFSFVLCYLLGGSAGIF